MGVIVFPPRWFYRMAIRSISPWRRNSSFLSSDATMPLETGPLRSGRLMLDMRSRQVWVNQQQMTAAAFGAAVPPVVGVVRTPGPRWSPRPGPGLRGSGAMNNRPGVTDQALDALIRRLRDRLAEMDPSHNYIITVRGPRADARKPAAGIKRQAIERGKCHGKLKPCPSKRPDRCLSRNCAGNGCCMR